jgi:hypothetical protein
MKAYLFILILLLSSKLVFTQDLPKNPVIGKCYVKCKTPEVWKNKDVTIKIAPAHKKITTHPAKYKTFTQKVLIKEAGVKLVVVPAVWEEQVVSYTAKEDATDLRAVNAIFNHDFLNFKTKSDSKKWVMGENLANCYSNDPNDCKYWYYKPNPPKYITLPITKLRQDASIVTNKVFGTKKTYVKRTMVKPPAVKEIETPAVYKDIQKTVLVKDAWKEEISVAAKYKTVSKKVLVDKGGLTSWKEVDCK